MRSPDFQSYDRFVVAFSGYAELSVMPSNRPTSGLNFRWIKVLSGASDNCTLHNFDPSLRCTTHLQEGTSGRRDENYSFHGPGYLAPLVAEFSADLRLLGYARLTIQFYAASARHFAAWVCETGLRLDELDLAVVERFARHHCRCPGGRRWSRVSRTYAKQTERFVLFLAARGVFSLTAPSIGIEPVQPGIRVYKQWLADHRGLSAVSIARQGRMLGPMLTTLGADPQAYNAATIRAAVRAASQGCSPSYVKTMTTALRGYLRFLAASGLCRPGLDGAIGQVAQWRLSALPRYLSTADVARVIATCDGDEPVNLRNRAALLLLARLGLRAGDVWSLRLDDFDWTAATLRVRGKSRCEVCLPLPQEVGDAVLAYIERGRPAVVDDRLFPASASALSTVYRAVVDFRHCRPCSTTSGH